MASESLLMLSELNNLTADDNQSLFNDSASTGGNSTVNTGVPVSWVYWLPGPLICSFGIICNVFNLCVLSQKRLSDSPYTYLTALAISDLILLTASFLQLVTSHSTRTYLKSFYDVYIFFSFGNIFFNASVWLVVALTIERVCFVTHPLTFHPSKKVAKICCVSVFIFCALINIPRFFCYGLIEYKGHFYPNGTPFRESKLFYRISWVHALVITFIPILILLVSNFVLIFAMRKAAKERAALHSNRDAEIRKDQTRLTRTLIAVVVVFIVCTFLSAFVEDPISYSLFGGDRSWKDYIKSPANQLFIYISNLLVFLNSSLNFVLYCSFNRKFRQAAATFVRKLHPYCRNLGNEIVSKMPSRNTISSRSYSFHQGETSQTNL
ncbi:probable G-protein coupled receptor B0563.6 [Ruditapes philippinarum]|uniref:probable G-protein coupled receptor B0563.6 n=1 Tax=Ruditapes philippinarum TaxID=129788 RepID=UPI00295A6704|nr:probable G-protein coupled receptor B0563.6 [Ruditapes philippinarum]